MFTQGQSPGTLTKTELNLASAGVQYKHVQERQ